jgi:Uma2 family endonuclease
MTLREVTVPSKPPALIPPLEAGDRLTRDEFERRYDAMPNLKKAELIEGVVHMPPPAVRWDYHGGPHIHLATWLGMYQLGTPGVWAGDNTSVRLDLENEPQPDLMLLVESGESGQRRLGKDGYVEGAPDLVAEISGSSVSIDMNAKLRVYRRNGVREYIVWRVRDRAIDWFALRQGEYQILPQADGITRSEMFPGLWLDNEAMINDPAANLRVLQQGLDSPEHQAFVAHLKSAGRKP